jgi:hypothetical protein
MVVAAVEEALVLVQPATVNRWYREGVHRCWRRRTRRPGRPRIDSASRDLIRRMAAENCLWGAPRIHGELLKLGIAISERTVSRYLRGRPPTRSQTWSTFFANHLGGAARTSPATFSDARGDDIVVDASGVSFRPTQLSINGPCVSAHWAVDFGAPLQSAFLGMRLRQDHRPDRSGACKSTGLDPPSHPSLQLPPRPTVPPCVCLQRPCERQHGEIILPREFTIGPSESLCGIESSNVVRGEPFLRRRHVVAT